MTTDKPTKQQRKPAKSKWTRIVYPICDLCVGVARWKHPEGGLRCHTCPKPEAR